MITRKRYFAGRLPSASLADPIDAALDTALHRAWPAKVVRIRVQPSVLVKFCTRAALAGWRIVVWGNRGYELELG